ncbi:four helix bundle protein [Dokdonia sinensis]|uniref:Four helix bundle protein n=1 Tax=Dokdonia sinensis TaxID=2479847 RepID=A0A3M0G4Y9_9FLAO|nr:four helix bundle protein [Dokdonia sinensis]RMB56913.1 four helix bundle protein [Dokdonia sinensis]
MKNRPYDLEERTFLFAQEVRTLIYSLGKSIPNTEDGKQVVRSSGSVAANYIEANEHLSDKDFNFRAKICRKEAKESVLWLKLLRNPFNENKRDILSDLIKEADELKRIFSSIIEKRKN